jgi:monoamine oxidase
MGTGAALSSAALVTRRSFVAAAALAACGTDPNAAWSGGWVGDAASRGHRLRDGAALSPTTRHRTDVLIVGGGIAGLAAARALRRAGIEDFALLDVHDAPGGNSRGHRLAGTPCPLGAHYLPVPGRQAHEVSEWLHEIGVARHALGRTVYDERHLCHSPQERLFFDGAWHGGLLPPADAGSATAAQYRRFAQLIDDAQRQLGFAVPTRRAAWTADHAALDAQTFGHWLSSRQLDDAQLRWYLDYCCRDDYGSDIGTVSAWAGLHYFASRHGFDVGDGDSEREPVLTWPQGNAWLVEALARALGERWHGAVVARRVSVERHGVSVDAWDDGAQQPQRWSAAQVVMATPLFIAARVIESPPKALRDAAAALTYAPWLVANLRLREPLAERLGPSLAWDNVIHGSRGLGYVDANHQSLHAAPSATVLTAYRALAPAQRAALLDQPWQHWAADTIDDLAATHPDLPRKLLHIDLTRHGHAMSIPAPGVRGHAALQALTQTHTPSAAASRLHFAHGDLAGYSVFEEAFTAGDIAGRAAGQALRRQ